MDIKNSKLQVGAGESPRRIAARRRVEFSGVLAETRNALSKKQVAGSAKCRWPSSSEPPCGASLSAAEGTTETPAAFAFAFFPVALIVAMLIHWHDTPSRENQTEWPVLSFLTAAHGQGATLFKPHETRSWLRTVTTSETGAVEYEDLDECQDLDVDALSITAVGSSRCEDLCAGRKPAK